MAQVLAQVAYKVYRSYKLQQALPSKEEEAEEIFAEEEEEHEGSDHEGEDHEGEEEEDEDEWVPKERRSRI